MYEFLHLILPPALLPDTFVLIILLLLFVVLSIIDLMNCILWPMAQARSGLRWGTQSDREVRERERENHVSLFCACVKTHGIHNSTPPPPERRRAITKISNTKYSDNNNVITTIRMK